MSLLFSTIKFKSKQLNATIVDNDKIIERLSETGNKDELPQSLQILNIYDVICILYDVSISQFLKITSAHLIRWRMGPRPFNPGEPMVSFYQLEIYFIWSKHP